MPYKFYLFASFLFLIFSCKKETQVCKTSIPIEVTGKKEVYLTQKIELTAFGKLNSTDTYEWIGPNNFKSMGKKLSLSMDDLSQGGQYGVRSTDKFDCISDYVYFDLKVNDIVVPCSLDANTMKVSSYVNSLYLYVNKNIDYDHLSYEASTSNYSNRFTLVFNSNYELGEGVFEINKDNFTDETGVLLSYQSDNLGNLDASSGQVYVKKTGNYYYATFCDIEFTNSNSSITVSSKINIY